MRAEFNEDLRDAHLVPLGREFYARPVLTVARNCVGKYLVSREADQLLVARIVEVEAYRGPEDRAAHSYGGRRTPRTEAMFGPPGHAYVFQLYGLHYNFNLVTGNAGEPHAVLIRAAEPLRGAALMAARRRGLSPDSVLLTNGPGKLCQAFAIGSAHYGRDLTTGPLFIADGPRPRRVAQAPRVGIDYAGSWARKPWRFFADESPYVSLKPR